MMHFLFSIATRRSAVIALLTISLLALEFWSSGEGGGRNSSALADDSVRCAILQRDEFVALFSSAEIPFRSNGGWIVMNDGLSINFVSPKQICQVLSPSAGNVKWEARIVDPVTGGETRIIFWTFRKFSEIESTVEAIENFNHSLKLGKIFWYRGENKLMLVMGIANGGV